MKNGCLMRLGIMAGLLVMPFGSHAGPFTARSLATAEASAPLNRTGFAFQDVLRLSIPELVRLESEARLIAQRLTADPPPGNAQLMLAMHAEALLADELSEGKPTAAPIPGAAWLLVSGVAGLAALTHRRRCTHVRRAEGLDIRD